MSASSQATVRLHLAVRRLDEAVLVDPAVRCERANEADVRAFRRLDRADPAVVAVVDVADVEPGALARQAARAEGAEAPLRRELGERVRLVHELAQLAAAEELLHRRHDRPDVDERVRRRLVDLLDRHALADDALHAQEADAEGVLDELAVRADAAIAEVVDVVGGASPRLNSMRWPTIAAMSSRVMVRSSRRSSMPIRPATASSFLLNL